MPEPESWKELGLCREVGGDMFFPENRGDPRPAVAICQSCPVAAQCLAYALRNREDVGVWGGTTARERARMRRNLQATV